MDINNLIKLAVEHHQKGEIPKAEHLSWNTKNAIL